MTNRFIKAVASILVSIVSFQSFAQENNAPTLPDVGTSTKDGLGILTWNNPYNSGVKSIIVQRSNDSVLNFAQIGNVPKLTGGLASFVDPLPSPGDNYYKLVILFTSGIEFKSNTVKVTVDSAAIANRKQLPPTDTLQKIINESIAENKPVTNTVAQVQTVAYPRSKYVFTNPFSGHINIELEDALKARYELIFKDLKDKELFRIPRIADQVVILDKRNFKKSGAYKFTLIKNGETFENGYITIY